MVFVSFPQVLDRDWPALSSKLVCGRRTGAVAPTDFGQDLSLPCPGVLPPSGRG